MKVETVLLEKCKPLTIAQGTGDWFLAKRFHFTGSVGAHIAAASYDIESDCWKSPLLNICVDSWFGRYVTTDDMQQGSTNEQLITQHMRMNEKIKDVFDVGMLQTTQGRPWLAISPDAIVLETI